MVKFADIRTARPPLGCRLAARTPWPVENQHLFGHCLICFWGGWLVRQVPVFRRKDGSIGIGTPNNADLDRDGRVRLGFGGKRPYRPIITFEDTAGRAILAAPADAGLSPAVETAP
jgi:hypothetical protein